MLTKRLVVKRVLKNQCICPTQTECPHYMELFNACMRPSVKCSYRTDNTKIKNIKLFHKK